MDKSSPDWSSLPDHLLAKIALRLYTRIDILRFRAVCNSFRSSVPLPPKPFSPFSDIQYHYTPPSYNISPIRFIIEESTVYALEPISEISNTHQTSRTWLLKVEESQPGRVQLVNPFSTFQFKHISEMLPRSLNLLDYRVKEISKGYRVELAKDQPTVDPDIFQKVAVSNDYNDEFAIMVYVNRDVAVWRRRDNKWAHIDIARRGFHASSDIIYHNKKFHVLSSSGLSISVDPKSFNVSETVAPLQKSEESLMWTFHLVKSCNNLFSVKINYYDLDNPCYINRFSRCYWVGLDIFKLVEEKNEWIEVKDGFKDRAFLICRECKFFLSAKEFSECKQNCVYKAERVPLGDSFDSNYYPGKWGVIFKSEDGNIGWLTSFPGDSEIFWPPPCWPFHEYVDPY